ncbi:hypothetical protein [Defluviimonas salinarum]|uniref:Transposase n=1 Tax=Defluviimonas salinarum TaxID=2992147 RepID=A0ABT3J488_9RHOB|nr:hypothetical protein [Defluviimonas salinarum]MCW3782511.1 hypothetical protein [Defluviimonas salinarum]
MPDQVRTFQIQLPRGAHEAALEAMAALFGRAERRLHAQMGRLNLAASENGWDRERINEARARLKRVTLAAAGITARQYNGLQRGLEGKHDSVRELARIRIERNAAKRADLAAKVESDLRRLAAQAGNDAAIAARAARGRGPTAAQARLAMTPADRRAARRTLHERKRRLGRLDAMLARDRAIATAAVPPIVFGSKDLLRARARIHANDRAGLLAWREKWHAARHREVMFIGSADETAGNQTCQALDAGAGRIALWIKMPPALAAAGFPDRLRIDDVDLPGFGGTEIAAALEGIATGARKVAIAYRFLRDPDWSERRHKSPWRVCVTIRCETPEASFDGANGVLAVDVNADHLALALVKGDGNPVRAWRIALPLRGRSAEARVAIIGDAARTVCAIAAAHGVPLALESLDFEKKRRELELLSKTARSPAERRYARMLSSFAHARIGTAIRRRAAREGIAVRDINPAYTSLIGRTNYARRYGLSLHQAAAVAIARRALGHSERINYVYGLRGRRNARPTRTESRRHVWRQWARLYRDTARTASGQSSSETPKQPRPSGAGRHGRSSDGLRATTA